MSAPPLGLDPVISAAYDPRRWTNFAVATAGAAATLSGLIFVAVSVNLRQIIDADRELGAGHLAGRTLEAIVQLLTVLAVSLTLLIPAQPPGALGSELILAATSATVVLVRGHLARKRTGVTPPGHPAWHWLRALTAWGTAIALLAAGATLIGHTGGGIYWIVPAILLAILGASANAWILLVEIVR